MLIGGTISLLGSIPIGRFLYFYFTEGGAGHIQSLVLGGVLLVIGLTTFLIGLVADLISFNRQLIEMTLEKVRRLELQAGSRENWPMNVSPDRILDEKSVDQSLSGSAKRSK